MRYRKNPVVIEAVQYQPDDESTQEALGAFLEGCTGWHVIDGPAILIPTLEGDRRAEPDDWIIKGVQGEFYPCKPDIFKQTYRPAGDKAPLAETWLEPSAQEQPTTTEACQYRSLLPLEVCAMTPFEARTMIEQAKRVLSAHLGPRGFAYMEHVVVFHHRGCK